jgi:copper homeostasis protein CutC
MVIQMEVCIDSFESAEASMLFRNPHGNPPDVHHRICDSVNNNENRIELCSNLITGMLRSQCARRVIDRAGMI